MLLGKPTFQVPLSVLNVGAHISAFTGQLEVELNWEMKIKSHILFLTHVKPVVRPAAKLHLAVLVVEGEPGDVDLAGRLEDARWNVSAHSLARHNHIRVIRPIKSFVSTGKREL